MNLQFRLIKIFFMLFLLALVQMAVFIGFHHRTYGFHSDLISPENIDSLFSILSFKSLPEPSVLCSKSPYLPMSHSFNLNFTCPMKTEVTEVFSVGVLGTSEQENQALSELNTLCYKNASEQPEIDYYDFYDIVLRECGYENSCNITV